MAAAKPLEFRISATLRKELKKRLESLKVNDEEKEQIQSVIEAENVSLSTIKKISFFERSIL